MPNFASKFLAASLVAIAMGTSAGAQQPDEAGRERIISEIRNYKHDFLARELDLTKEQQREFFAVYDRMDDQIQQINAETRELERRMLADKEATDTELEAAAAAVYTQKAKEGEVEKEYFEQFKEKLSPRQLLLLKPAEKKFAQNLMRHHRRLKKKNNND